MLYCTKCHAVCENAMQKCPSCKSAKLRQANPDDYVLLHHADQYTTQRLVSQFEDFSLDYRLEDFSRGRVSYLYDSEVMPTDKTIFVRFRDLLTAQGLSAKLEEDIKVENGEKEDEFEEMPRKKRIVIQIVSVVAFLVLVTVTVFAADWVGGWIRSFFV